MITLLISFLFQFHTSANAQDLNSAIVLNARATNVTAKELFGFLNSESRLQFNEAQQFSKIEIIFHEKLKMDRVSIETCGENFKDGVDFYLNYDEEFKFFEGGRNLISYDLTQDSKGEKGPKEVAALTINFRRNTALCLKSISFYLGTKTFRLSPSELVKVKLNSSKNAKGEQNLFDSKLNSYLRFSASTDPSFLSVKFDQVKELTHLLIWPGNFTNDTLFKKYSRPKKIEVECDHNEKEGFELRDEMVVQKIVLSKVQKCGVLKISVTSSYAGISSGETQISEVRMLNDEKVFLPDQSSSEIKLQSLNESRFEDADLGEVLEKQLISVETPRPSMLRVHKDGSFFLRGFDELAKENETFYIIGEMQPMLTKTNRIQLLLTGIKRSSTLEMDSLSCGRKCFQEKDYSNEKFFFEQKIQIRRGKDGFYRIDTLAPKKQRRIDFTSIRFLIDHSL